MILRLLLPCFLFCFHLVRGQEDWLQSLEVHRQKYRTTYLQPERQVYEARDTQYLRFFEPDETFRIIARFEPDTNARPFLMPTYSGQKQRMYRAYGTLHFMLENRPCQLTVYRMAEPSPLSAGLLFLPFKDPSNGEETYGGGRYLEMRMSDLDDPRQVILDFNFCYNPLCAYSDKFNCPIPPAENHLDVVIAAGEKAFARPDAKH